MGKVVIVKQRFSKQYRHPVLDSKLTVGRLNQAGGSCSAVVMPDVILPCLCKCIAFSRQSLRPSRKGYWAYHDTFDVSSSCAICRKFAACYAHAKAGCLLLSSTLLSMKLPLFTWSASKERLSEIFCFLAI